MMLGGFLRLDGALDSIVKYKIVARNPKNAHVTTTFAVKDKSEPPSTTPSTSLSPYAQPSLSTLLTNNDDNSGRLMVEVCEASDL